MHDPAPVIVVITDANVLINFCHIEQVTLFGALEGYEFRMPPEVLEEITDAAQRAMVDSEIAAGHLNIVAVDTIEALTSYAELRDLMGRGEAACLALAATAGTFIASDEKKRFRKKAVELLGEERILRTEDLLLSAIKVGVISVEQADSFKAVLGEHRYTMTFASFAELMNP